MDALDEPARTAVFAAQRDFVAGQHPVAADVCNELIAMRGILIQIARSLLHELLARRKAEDAGHRGVAFEDAAVDRRAINTGDISFEEKPVPLLAAAQRGLGAMALYCIDKDLAADAQQRNRLLGPNVRSAARDAERAEKLAVVNHRHDHDGVIAG